MKIIFLIFFLCNSLFAQFSKDDFELVKTTYQRIFDKEIISSYLNSGEEKKIRAALLSIANSQDTSFVDNVISLNFLDHADYICFTIGLLGESKKSSQFLFNKLNESQNDEISKFILEAIGRVGSKTDLEILINTYLNSSLPIPNGIGYAFVNFSLRNINNDLTKEILLAELQNQNLSVVRKSDAAYALSRLGGFEKANEILVTLIKENIFNNDQNEKLIQYSLSSLRRVKHFPQDSTLLATLIYHPNWIIRVETAKSAVHFNYNKKDLLFLYKSLLDDSNPNVSTQAAISLKELNFSANLKKEVTDTLYNLLLNNVYNPHTKGELFLSYYSLFPPKEVYDTYFIIRFEGMLSKEFIYRFMGDYRQFVHNPISNLTNLFRIEDYENRIYITEALMKIHNDKAFNSEILNSFLLQSLRTAQPAIVGLIAEGLNQNFIAENESALREIINSQITKNINNSDYTEILISLSELAAKIELEFEKQILSILKTSRTYSIKKYALQKLNEPLEGLVKELGQFNTIWNNAFKFKTATVITEIGEFKIEFMPDYAPVSVGSFCLSVQQRLFARNIFHRVVPGFVIQAGDPSKTGWGGPGYQIISEYSPLYFSTNFVGMASSGKDTEGSQWFVSLASFPHLNGRYTVFARVIEGFDVVNLVQENTIINRIEIK